MKYQIAYKHCGKGCGVFLKDFPTDKSFRTWLGKKFTADESEFKLIGILKQ